MLRSDFMKINTHNKFKGAPFWAWNTHMTEEKLASSIDVMARMGMGGFFIHPRFGLCNEYLGEEYIYLVTTAVKKAKELNMYAWLYDEDCWPSGFAGGKVTDKAEHRAKRLLISPNVYCDDNKELLATFDIVFNKKGEMLSFEFAGDKSTAGILYYAYKVTAEDDPWYNNQSYSDILSEKTTERFIDLTHEVYKKALGSEFGKTIPGIFTDEPHFEKKRLSTYDVGDAHLAWTDDFDEKFKERFGKSILPLIPELFWNNAYGNSDVRYLYHRLTSDLFYESFIKPVSEWCRKNNLMLTGHLCGEDSLLSQTECNGDAMLAYTCFDIPGFDILCGRIELTTANQVRSVANQYGRKQISSELYGVTGWACDFRDYKFQGDWQTAFGVSVRAHHLAWESMKGEGKRDYPASINYQSPWYEDFSFVENHYSRINSLLEGSINIIRVAVVSPLESFWLHYGCRTNNEEAARQIENNYENVTKWLLTSMINFDFLSESVLEKSDISIGDSLTVGEANYEVIIVPGCETLRANTVNILSEFVKQGGNVIFMGKLPNMVDAKISRDISKMFSNCSLIPFYRSELMDALADTREIFLKNKNSGTDCENFICSYRMREECRWLFLAHIAHNADSWQDRAYYKALSGKEDIIIKIKGAYTPVLYNTVNATVNKIPYYVKDGYTYIDYTIHAYESLLIKLEKYTVEEFKYNDTKITTLCEVAIPHSVKYVLSDENVFLLDRAEFSLDGSGFERETDILRIDKLIRCRLGMFEDYWIQPYAKPADTQKHYVELMFQFESRMDVTDSFLALENAENAEIIFNGDVIKCLPCGYYADKEIKKIHLGKIKYGNNILKIKLPFGERTNLENCYVLGDFGVKVNGCEKVIIPREEKLTFSSVTNQSLAFYSGNITYKIPITTNGEDIFIHLNNYRGAAIKVRADGKDCGYIVYPPYDLRICDIEKGTHVLEFVLLGNRANTFGPLHNADLETTWIGYQDWRTEGDKWCDEYILNELGIMSAPKISLIKPQGE